MSLIALTHCGIFAINMNLSSEDLFLILCQRVSEDTPHRDYQRTVDHAKWCKQIVTGDDQKEILVSYKIRETQKQVDQRVRITNSRTQYVANKVKKLYNEVHRCDDVEESISYPQKQQNPLTELTKALDTWYENKPLKKYISTRFKDLVFEDPNAYIIVEFENNDPVNKKPTVYPFEVRSDEVFWPHYINGVLQYLIIFETIVYLDAKGKELKGHKYTMYGIGHSFVMKHIPHGAVYDIPEGWQTKMLKIANKKQEQKFIWQYYETKSVECPAFRVGYMDDPHTDGRTKVTPMWPAKNILTDLIWNKSEYDLSKALHGFYQKFMYVQKCKVCSGEGYVCDREHDDRMVTCEPCKGTGKDMHTTVQDVVMLTLPADTTQVIDLSRLVHYAQIPDTLITKQREDVEKDQKDVFNAIFGANVLERSELVETATAKNYDWRAVNNTLFEYADHVAEFFKHAVRNAANHRGEAEGLTLQYSFPSDFKLESVQDLIDQRSSAVTAAAPMAVISTIDMAILGKQHKDDPEFLKAYKAREQFRPMRDKNANEKMVLLSTLSNDDQERVLYVYYERIMDDIFDEVPHFPDMAYKKQREIVYKKVDEFIAAKVKKAPSMSNVLSDSLNEEE